MHAMPLNFATLQRIFLAIGVVSLAVSCLMTYKFGSTMSLAHAIGLVGVTICAAFIFPAKKYIEQMGDKKAAKWVHRFGVFFIAVELFSHAGYTIGMREMSVQNSGVQTANWEIAQKQLESEVANLDMWRKQLADLKARNAKHLEKNQGWLVSVDPTAMEEAMSALDQKIENEANRKFCGRKCEALKEQKANLSALIANVKEENDLTTRIEATQKIIDGKANVATTTDKGFSAASAQTGFVSQVVLLVTGSDAEAALSPDKVTTTVTGIFIGLLIALAATFLPTMAFYLAFFGRTDETEPAMTQTHRDIKDVMDGFKAKAHDTASNVNATFITAKDDMARDIAELLARAGSQLKAA